MALLTRRVRTTRLARALLLASSGVAAAQDFEAPWIGYDTSTYPAGHLPWASRTADFDADGVPDVAVVTWHANSQLEILFGRSDGGFEPPVAYALQLGSLDLDVADLDGDGDPDIAVSNTGQFWEGTAVSVFHNDGAGGFPVQTFHASGTGPTGVAAADHDNDGDVDLAVAHDKYIVSASTIAVMTNTGEGGFASPLIKTVGPGTYKIAAGDLTGDGFVDLAVAHEGGRVSVMPNGPSGFALVAAYVTPGSSYQFPTVTLADVDLDDDLDVLYSGAEFFLSPERIALFRNQGNGTLSPFQALPTPGLPGATDIDVADLDGDGWPDVVGAGERGQGWSLLLGDGAGGLQAAQVLNATEDPIAIEVPDLDGDGDRDVVVIGRNSLEAAVYLNPGDAAFWQPVPQNLSNPALAPSSYSRLATGDVDGDGDLDAAVGWRENFGTQEGLTLARNTGAGAFTLQALAVPELPADVLLEDMDGDGDLDLLLADAEFPYALRWKLNDGAGGFGATQGGPGVPCGPGDIAAEDLNGDGLADVMWAGESGCFDEVFISLATGSGYAAVQAVSLTTSATFVDAGDFDADGDADLVTNSAIQGYLEISLGNGDGTFAPPFVAFSDEGAVAVAIADLDGDSFLDLGVTHGVSGDTLAVLLGYGDGGFKPPQVYAGGYSAFWDNVHDIDAADIDGDGDVDLAVGNYGSQDVSVWRNLGGTFTPQVRYGAGHKVFEAELADFTGDGRTDVLALVEPVAPNGWYHPALQLLEGQAPGSTWVDLGHALAGGAGTPHLSGTGPLEAGATVSLALASAKALSTTGLVVGLSQLLAPFKGGVLVPEVDLLLVLTTDAGGGFVLAGEVPPLPAGLDLFVQAWIADAGGPHGWAASNGLQSP